MKQVELTPDIESQVIGAMGSTIFFSNLETSQAEWVVRNSTFLRYETGETVVEQGEPADCFYLMLKGTTRVLVRQEEGKEEVEVGKLTPPRTIGEIGILLEQTRTATVITEGPCLMLRFEQKNFNMLFDRVQGFGKAVCGTLARRLEEVSRRVPVASRGDETVPDPQLVDMLPLEFIQRHRVLPLELKGKLLTVGLVDDLNPRVITQLRKLLPGMNVNPVAISTTLFDRTLRGVGTTRHPAVSAGGGVAAASEAPALPAGDVDLDALLRRMVAEGASDLHLSAGHRPRWRVDGEMIELSQLSVMGKEDVLALLRPMARKRHLEEFADENDVDFGFTVDGLARFRVNLFHDQHGIGAVLRVIPSRIMTLEQLGMPDVLKELCEYKKGLILVTGPTGSGKSTTLAAMVDYINARRPEHIITLEDPIEFVHRSQSCLVNQREVGAHTKSFHRALKAALREDPDIVLVGEMRDLETMALAMETANTGHLVLGTLHTATAISTIDRIIDLFPADRQGQVRAGLGESLLGVVAQTLCKRVGGGRVAAVEVLVVNGAVSNLIREAKTNQILSIMQTGKKLGNTLLNEELARLVRTRVINPDEAMDKAADKQDLVRKLGELR